MNVAAFNLLIIFLYQCNNTISSIWGVIGLLNWVCFKLNFLLDILLVCLSPECRCFLGRASSSWSHRWCEGVLQRTNCWENFETDDDKCVIMFTLSPVTTVVSYLPTMVWHYIRNDGTISMLHLPAALKDSACPAWRTKNIPSTINNMYQSPDKSTYTSNSKCYDVRLSARRRTTTANSSNKVRERERTGMLIWKEREGRESSTWHGHREMSQVSDLQVSDPYWGWTVMTHRDNIGA